MSSSMSRSRSSRRKSSPVDLRRPALQGNPGPHPLQGAYFYQPELYPDSDSPEPHSDSDGEGSSSDSTATLVINPPRIKVLEEPLKWKIQGHYSLPHSYCLACLPAGTLLQPLSTSDASKEEIVISNSYGIIKAFSGIVQIVSSLYALYASYGDQTRAYGYAAFGFTVLPYTIMSVLNTIANLIEASYDCLFLVRSDVMAEAELRERGEFIGEVAELVPAGKEHNGMRFIDLRFVYSVRGRWRAFEVDDNGSPIPSGHKWRVHIPNLLTYNEKKDPRAKIHVQPLGQSYRFSQASHRRSQVFRRRAGIAMILFALVTPYIVIGSISRFQKGRSTARQRVFMVGWLMVGQVIGALNLVKQGTKARRKHWWWVLETTVKSVVVIIGITMAIGGFYEVGSMLRYVFLSL